MFNMPSVIFELICPLIPLLNVLSLHSNVKTKRPTIY